MATSGVYTYSIDRDTLIKSAFRTLGVFNDDSSPPATDIANAAQALNLMIKQWMAEGYPLWTVDYFNVPLIANQRIYSLGPGGVGTYRPLRITSGYISHASSGLDVPLTQLSRQEYNMLGNKSQNSGVPNSFYYDPRLLQGNLYVWIPSATTVDSLNLTVQRPMMDMANSTDSFDFPIECLNAIRWGLAEELLPEYDIPAAKMQMIIGRAEKLKETMFDNSVEEAGTFFTPQQCR